MNNTKDTLRVVAYVREEMHDESIDTQLLAIQEYAKLNNMIIMSQYIDNTSVIKQRLEFNRMLKNAKKKEFDVILVNDFNKFASNPCNLAINKHILKEKNIQLISINDPLGNLPDLAFWEVVVEYMCEYNGLNKYARKVHNERELEQVVNMMLEKATIRSVLKQ